MTETTAADVLSLTALAEEQLAVARTATAGRAARTIHGHGGALRQTLMTLTSGCALGEHDSPGEATLHVLRGRVHLIVGDDHVEAAAGDYLIIPPTRHDLAAIEDSAVLLTVVVGTHA